MISIDQLKAVTQIITHANCADGFASAVILRAAYDGINLPVRFMVHGSQEFETLKAEPGMLFCDLAPPAARACDFMEAGSLVLDHHKSAREICERFESIDQGIFADEFNPEDAGHSGAWLAWKHVHLPLKGNDEHVRSFAELASVRDTWQTQDARWRASCIQAEALKFFGEKILAIPILHEDSAMAHIEQIGELLLDKRKESVAKSVQWMERALTAEYRVAIIHNYDDISDAAEAIGDEADVVAAFGYRNDRGVLKLNVSLRSRGEFDCGKCAKSWGGGGHKNAAGFTLSNESVLASGMVKMSPHDAILDVIRNFEANELEERRLDEQVDQQRSAR